MPLDSLDVYKTMRLKYGIGVRVCEWVSKFDCSILMLFSFAPPTASPKVFNNTRVFPQMRLT